METQRLTNLVGKGKAIELITTGMVLREELLQWGLVNNICKQSELMSTCEKISF